VTNRQIDDAFEFSGMAGHWTSSKSQPTVPTLDQIPTLLDVLGLTLDDVPDDVRRLIWTLNGRKGQPGAAWYERGSTGHHDSASAASVWRYNYQGATSVPAAKERKDVPATEAARQWDGWGTALKPAHEPIVLARKPLSGTVAHNVTTHGTGAINVDACRVGSEPIPTFTAPTDRYIDRDWRGEAGKVARTGEVSTQGRWPANVLHDGSPEVVAGFPVTSPSKAAKRGTMGLSPFSMIDGSGRNLESDSVRGHDDTGGTAARFFYHAKASRAERERGLTHREPETVGDGRAVADDNAYQRGKTQRRNVHPTVKPVAVMRWLVRLVTPPGGVVLDPFTGSGTTGVACALEGFDFLGCELSPEYAQIARDRIRHAESNPHPWDPETDPPATDAPETVPGQTSLLDLI